MKLNLGGTIRSLRQAQGKTQEQLARALDVTSQAVSRWEAQGSYPDMELIPAIANFFGITIDQLFGYENQREQKIDALLERVDALDAANQGCDQTIDECLQLLREGMAEFPGNRRILYRLGLIHTEAGWVRQHERSVYNADGYLEHDIQYGLENPHWQEAVKIFENLIAGNVDDVQQRRAKVWLIRLYRNRGEYEKAAVLASAMPEMDSCREFAQIDASDGREHAVYLGDALMKLAEQLAEQTMQALMSRKSHFADDLAIRKIRGILALFELLCEDGNLGQYHTMVGDLYLYMSEHQWRIGDHDGAFASLDLALEHAVRYDALAEEHMLTASLVEGVSAGKRNPASMARSLAEDWPVWCYPACDDIWQEMQNDPRFDDWLRRTKE